jgi:hypothetical protein
VNRVKGQGTVFYRGWVPRSVDEVTAEQVEGLDLHSRAFLSSDGRPARLELYSDGELKEVVYYGADAADVVAVHARDYPGTALTTQHDVSEVDGFRWVLSKRYSPGGELSGMMMRLLERGDDVELMDVNAAPDGNVSSIMKFHYDSRDDMHYAFEYDRDGENTAVYDLTVSSEEDLAEALQHVPDPDFYAEGYALPRQVRTSPIPPFPGSPAG